MKNKMRVEKAIAVLVLTFLCISVCAKDVEKIREKMKTRSAADRGDALFSQSRIPSVLFVRLSTYPDGSEKMGRIEKHG